MSGYNVLVVDDSPTMRSFLKRALDATGAPIGAVFEASDGREALDVVRQNWVDVVLTDLHMPGMPGVEFLSELRQQPSFADLPVVVVSSDRTDARRAMVEELGVSGFLPKPVSPAALRDVLESIMRWTHA